MPPADRENVPAAVLQESEAAYKCLQEAGVHVLVNDTLAVVERKDGAVDKAADGLLFYGSPQVTKYAKWETGTLTVLFHDPHPSSKFR